MSYVKTAASTSLKDPLIKITCDLRSDTVTVPCQGMRQAMAEAPVGDDVMMEDPTVNELERAVAKICGKEAGLFVASGTMSNQLGIRAKIGAMESIVCDARCHIHLYEVGGVAYHCGAQMLPVDPPVGKSHITVETIAKAMLGENILYAKTKMILIENTLRGTVFPLDELKRIKKFAEEHDMWVHIDGARIWNASIATGISLEEYSRYADSVSLCLSKTLGAPIGSVLVGTNQHIARARQFRKLFGGGWRQAGLLAAAGLYAIEHNYGAVLKGVHDCAKLLANGLTKLGFIINADVEGVVDTNMVFADMRDVTAKTDMDWYDVAMRLEGEGIKIYGPKKDETSINRLVLHHQASTADIIQMLTVIGEMIRE
eukprot:Ihof_evm1s972 gene=Ihof_evmTU1s972